MCLGVLLLFDGVETSLENHIGSSPATAFKLLTLMEERRRRPTKSWTRVRRNPTGIRGVKVVIGWQEVFKPAALARRSYKSLSIPNLGDRSAVFKTGANSASKVPTNQARSRSGTRSYP